MEEEQQLTKQTVRDRSQKWDYCWHRKVRFDMQLVASS
jgi:hypothetical protein